ncbi:MAG: monovalent cation/H+ antiporter complex subunit F [Hyphomicrobiales bacterium]|nr:monovalent cation/H+ antiporter complex subunit F [Hyphomicrobiales bacterium]
MTAERFLEICILMSLALLAVSFLMITVRIVIGPTLADRVLALDSLVSIGIGFIAIIAIKTGYPLYVDVAIALGLVGFLATVALARFILRRERPEGSEIAAAGKDRKTGTP